MTRIVTMVTLKTCYVTKKKGNKENQTISIFIFTVISTEKQGYDNFLFFIGKGGGGGGGRYRRNVHFEILYF